jgi:hypothetical protein
MSVQRIDDLIEAARNAMDDDLDLGTIHEWKQEAVAFLTEHLGPDHYYTQYFTTYMKQLEQQNLLTGRGLLTAAREEIAARSAGIRRVDRPYSAT